MNFQSKNTTTDGWIYTIVKFQNNCRNIDNNNYKNSDCIIEVDTNGLKKPNKYGKDKIIFIIDGINNKIIPTNETKKMIDNYKAVAVG